MKGFVVVTDAERGAAEYIPAERMTQEKLDKVVARAVAAERAACADRLQELGYPDLASRIRSREDGR